MNKDARKTMLSAASVSILTSMLTILVNLVVGSSHLVAQLRLKEAGAGTVAITGTLSVWAAVCSVTAFCVGRVLTERNARHFLEMSAVLFVLAFAGMLAVPQTAMLYFWLFLIGLATASFCAPLQVFLKKLEHGKTSGLIRASALYSASWSFGMAVGPFIFSLFSLTLGENAWRTALILNAVLMSGAVFLPALAERLAAGAERTETIPDRRIEDDLRGKPDLAPAGWVLTVAAFSAVAVTKTQLPAQGREAGLTEAEIGLVAALIYFAHSFTSLCLIRSRNWMYRRTAVRVFTVCGIAGLVCFLFLQGGCVPLLAAGAVMIGSYSGLVGFCLVFYSLAHPEKAAKHVAVNEVVVGLTNMSAPLLIGSGFILLTGRIWVPFAALTVPAVLAALFHAKRIKNAE